jgi:hypothetical protein
VKPPLALCLGLLVTACEARTIERPSPAAVDKAAVFGSAELVPTREGERVRRELAIAGSLEQALARLGLGPAHVDVELREPVTVIVIATLPEPGEVERAEASVAELVGAMVPSHEPAELHVWWRPALVEAPASAPDRTWTRWALLLCCVGLGLSLGVGTERLRARW